MATANITLEAGPGLVQNPLVWRLQRLFHVATNITRARVSDDRGLVDLQLEGSDQEIEAAKSYIAGLSSGQKGAEGEAPERDLEGSTIYVRLSAINLLQSQSAIVYRIGRDFDVAVNIVRAAFDQEDGGYLDVALTGELAEIQRAIAYLHTTGIHVNPRQRSVSDGGNL